MNIIEKYIFRIIRTVRDLLSLPVEYKIYKRKRSLPKIIPGLTSFSDTNEYTAICKLAAEYEDIFKIFKRSRDYRKILEHVSKKEGLEYLKIIKAEEKKLLRYSAKFKENDRLGSPVRFKYDIGRFSPTTLLYIKVLADLKALFGDLNNFNIVEIGGGYGGQCKIISDVFKPRLYTIIDLDAVLPLAQKYLAKLNVENVSFLTQRQIGNEEYDLVVSNYAFSECIKSVQDDYITKILYRSKKGYLTCTYDEPSSPTSPYNKKELSQRLSKRHAIDIIDEKPKTGPFNFIIKWMM